VTAYCLVCLAEQPMKDAEAVTLKDGRGAWKGRCARCGAAFYKVQNPH
jgi:hypothetical protein